MQRNGYTMDTSLDIENTKDALSTQWEGLVPIYGVINKEIKTHSKPLRVHYLSFIIYDMSPQNEAC